MTSVRVEVEKNLKNVMERICRDRMYQLKIFGYTKNPLAPVKPFEFRVGDNNKVLRIK